ncbi:hypothetical protein V8E52_006899 [Russula decolorans]
MSAAIVLFGFTIQIFLIQAILKCIIIRSKDLDPSEVSVRRPHDSKSLSEVPLTRGNPTGSLWRGSITVIKNSTSS